MMRTVSAMAGAVALALSSPAMAQQSDDAVAIVDAIWPDGTMATMMQETMGPMMDQMMAGMMDMPMETMMASIEASIPEEKRNAQTQELLSGLTMGEMMNIVDPYFLERQSIMMDIMAEEMTPMMVELEPVLKERLAAVMDRKYTDDELSAARRFFDTAEGRAFGAKFMEVYSDPEYMAVMGEMMPGLMEIMPRVMERMASQTAHLPAESTEGMEDRIRALLEEKEAAQ